MIMPPSPPPMTETQKRKFIAILKRHLAEFEGMKITPELKEKILVANDAAWAEYTTVMQWLGSKCGLEFLEMALRKCGYKLEKMEE